MIAVNCDGCGREFLKQEKYLKHAARNFCSRSCLPVLTCSCGVTFRARWASSATCRKCRADAIRERNRETIRANQNAAYAANPERAKANARRHYAENRDTHNAQNVAWVKANPEGRREITKRFRQRHPEMFKAKDQRRRARKRAALGSFSAAEWTALVEKQNGRCANPTCRKKAPLDADHIIPLVDGGSGYIFNIQGLCGPCNGSKGAKIIPGSQSTLFDRPPARGEFIVEVDLTEFDREEAKI